MFNEGYVIGGSFQLPLYAGDPPEVGFVDQFEIILILLRLWSFVKHLPRLKSSSSCSASFVVFQFQVVVNSLRTDSCVNVLASFRRRKMVGFYSHRAFMSCHCITLKFMSYIAQKLLDIGNSRKSVTFRHIRSLPINFLSMLISEDQIPRGKFYFCTIGGRKENGRTSCAKGRIWLELVITIIIVIVIIIIIIIIVIIIIIIGVVETTLNNDLSYTPKYSCYEVSRVWRWSTEPNCAVQGKKMLDSLQLIIMRFTQQYSSSNSL